MRRAVATVLATLGTLMAFSQLGGEATYQFLNLVSSPRQAALGGKTLTNVDYDVIEKLYSAIESTYCHTKNVSIDLVLIAEK